MKLTGKGVRRLHLPVLAMLWMLFGSGDALTQCPTAPVVHSGEATYYTFADGTGNCMFDATPDDLMIGAMNDPDYGNAEACGECVRLSGPDATIDIRIVDRCPGCASGDIDLSPEAFSMIADLSRGRVPITWYVIPCDVAGPIAYHFKEGSNQWWTAVQIRNHRNAVRRLEYLNDQQEYGEVNRTQYNYFVETAGMGPGPYTFRVTDVYGHVLVDSGVSHVEDSSVAGTGQFPLCDTSTTAVREAVHTAAIAVEQNYPNPFNPATIIRFVLPQRAFVTLRIFNILGEEVETLLSGEMTAGLHEIVWDGSGRPAGIYFYHLQTAKHSFTREMALLR